MLAPQKSASGVFRRTVMLELISAKNEKARAQKALSSIVRGALPSVAATFE
jgi:hypothetical protein